MRVELSDCIPTAHFLEKKESRGVSWEDIRTVIEHPNVIEPTHQGRWRYVRGDVGLAIVVAHDFKGKGKPIPMKSYLITILLRQGEQWTDEDVRVRRTYSTP